MSFASMFREGKLGSHLTSHNLCSKEKGYHSLQKNFGASKIIEPKVSAQAIHKSAEKKSPSQASYQLVSPSRSYIPRTTEETPQIAQTITAMADKAISAADEMVEGLGEMIAPSIHDDNYAEIACQRKLRNQPNRNKR